MSKFYLLMLIILSSSCAHTVFAPPKILYATDKTIGVKYRSSGIQSHDEAEKAMQLVSKHCYDKYQVTSRAIDNGWTNIDARCG